MSTTKIQTIKNFRTDVPGELSENGKKWEFPVIENKDHHGNVIKTEIIVTVRNENDNDIKISDRMFDNEQFDKIKDAIIETKITNLKTGNTRASVPQIVKTGKNLGKKNQTNQFTQALSDARSLYNKKLRITTKVKEGEKEKNGEEEKEKEGDEQMKYRFPPMLASKNTKPIDFSRKVFYQHKFDGMRAVAFYNPKRNPIPLTKASLKEIKNNPEVLNEYDSFVEGENNFVTVNSKYVENLGIECDPSLVEIYGRTRHNVSGKNNVRISLAMIFEFDKDIYLDFELYSEGKPLQKITSQASKELDDGSLKAYLFDCFYPSNLDQIYVSRKEKLEELFEKAKNKYGDKFDSAVLVDTKEINSDQELNEEYKKSLDAGYEGGIARYGDVGYKYSYSNYHSMNLVKIKPVHCDEFTIVSYTSSKKGKAEGMIKLIAEAKVKNKDEKKNFELTFKGLTEREQKDLYNKMSEIEDNGKTHFENSYFMKPITVEYQDVSSDGIPLRAKAVAVRDYE